MATYKYPQFLAHNQSPAFDQVHAPNSLAPFSGIYRCVRCGLDAVSVQQHPLPPQNHHQHAPRLGPIAWQLSVAT